MSNPQRHIGKMTATGQRVVVVFMQIPDREDHALVVASDSLPPRFEQNLMDIVMSPEGQSAVDLATVLGRRMMSDQPISILQALHNGGFLAAVSIDAVTMFPMPNAPYPLRDVLTAMGRLINAPAPQTPQDPYNGAGTSDQGTTGIDATNQFTQNQSIDSSVQNLMIARNILAEAEMLEVEARRKREMAYTRAPELRPSEPVASSVLTPVETKRTTAKRTTATKGAVPPKKRTVKAK